MSKIVVSTFVTLDGVMESPEKWSFDFQSDENHRAAQDLVSRSDALLLGRVTYEGFAAAWPSRGGEFADKMNSMPKYVVSTTLEDPDWNNSTVIGENVVDEVSKLKEQQDGQILMYGSGSLMRTLMEHDLIDEYNLLLNPVVVGQGKRLFADGGERKTFKLADATPYSGGIVVLRYERAASA